MTDLSEDIHYLEVNPDNNLKSRELKKKLNVFLKKGAIAQLYDEICEIRFEINSSLPYYTINKDGNRKKDYYPRKTNQSINKP